MVEVTTSSHTHTDYALKVVEDQRWTDSSQQRQDIRDALDGYAGGGATINVEDEGVGLGSFNTLNFIGDPIIATDAGGGQANITVDVEDLEDQVTNIQNDLDGYATKTTENQRWSDSSQQRQDIRDALDGYAGGGATINVEDEGAPLGSFDTLDFTGKWVTATDAGGGEATINVDTKPLEDQVTNIQNDLDGYALSTVEDQRWYDGSQQRQDIRDSIDGYSIKVVEDQRWSDSSQQRQDIRDALDGYSGGGATISVEDEGVSLGNFNTLNFIGEPITATDAGGGQANITVDVEDLEDQVTNLQNDLDGYATKTTENQRWTDSSQQRQDIRDVLDGYEAIDIEDEGIPVGSFDTLDFSGRWVTVVDGGGGTAIVYISNQTLEDQVTDIQNELDGYAQSSIEDQHWADSSQQRQDIRDALDGYSGGGTINIKDEGVGLGSFDTLDFVGEAITATDAGGGEATITVEVEDLEDQVTYIQNNLDGYATKTTENQRWSDSSQQRQDIRDVLDGYSGGGATIGVEDEGVSLGNFNTLNFVGATVAATDAGGGQADITHVGGLTKTGFKELTTDASTTSTSAHVDLLSFTYNKYSNTSDLIIHVTVSASVSANSRHIRLRLTDSGTPIRGFAIVGQANEGNSGALIVKRSGLAAGNHTFAVQWLVESGTANCRPATTDYEHCSLFIQEVSA
jgi:predicted ATP-grasp superfamily ATP-dependent carboligase